MPIIEGIDSKSRERVYTDNFNEQKQFALEAFKTSPGQRFLSEFDNSPENIQVVLDAAATLYPGELVTVSRFVGAMEAAMRRAPSLDRWKRGLLKRKPAQPAIEPTPAVEVPRDKNNRPLSQSQIEWGTMARWSNEHSAEECRKRAQTDQAYRSFMETNLRREMNSRPVDAAPSAGVQSERSATTADIHSELGTFASLYKNAPAERIRRPIAGRYILDATHTYSVQEFERNLTEAARIGLL